MLIFDFLRYKISLPQHCISQAILMTHGSRTISSLEAVFRRKDSRFSLWVFLTNNIQFKTFFTTMFFLDLIVLSLKNQKPIFFQTMMYHFSFKMKVWKFKFIYRKYDWSYLTTNDLIRFEQNLDQPGTKVNIKVHWLFRFVSH